MEGGCQTCQCLLDILCGHAGQKDCCAVVTVSDATGKELLRMKTRGTSPVCLRVDSPGEYMVTVRAGFPAVPQVHYCRAWLDPRYCVFLRLKFARRIPRGGSRLFVTLADAAYPNQTLEGGVIELWRIYC